MPTGAPAIILSAGMIYLRANPLLREPLKPEHIKNRLLGHWGSDPGQSFVWVHLNRLIRKYDLECHVHLRPGPRRARHARQLLSRRVTIPKFIRTRAAMKRACSSSSGSFPFPDGIGSHCTPETPGSIHEGGELGYSHLACVRSGVRQSRSHRWRRGRRWRGRDRSARDLLAFQQVPESDSRWRGSAGTPSQRLQDRKSHHSRRAFRAKNWRRCSPDMATNHTSSKATTRLRCIRKWLRLWSNASSRFVRSQQHARSTGDTDASALADDRACARPKDGPGQKKSTATRWKASGARTRFRCSTRLPIRDI